MPDQHPPHTPGLTDEDLDRLVNRLVDRLSDRRTVEQITDAWSGVVDRALGRGLRRLAFTVICAALVFGAVKFEVLSRFFKG